jgi:hypothetical protein
MGGSMSFLEDLFGKKKVKIKRAVAAPAVKKSVSPAKKAVVKKSSPVSKKKR